MQQQQPHPRIPPPAAHHDPSRYSNFGFNVQRPPAAQELGLLRRGAAPSPPSDRNYLSVSANITTTHPYALSKTSFLLELKALGANIHIQQIAVLADAASMPLPVAHTFPVGTLFTQYTSSISGEQRKQHWTRGESLTERGSTSKTAGTCAKGFSVPEIKANVVEIAKSFRNNHFAAAALKTVGGTKLTLLQDI
ncbi:hypothetical protein UY3_08980 [Chelonia mydas]|uniref:Uncharacterized protein n=1 Tax=Chelonia mydas TaxID=8469 RepID=M7B7I2_CHEMY|nr:hypothetical protein UY3_08980 [Chelonia mydas]